MIVSSTNHLRRSARIVSVTGGLLSALAASQCSLAELSSDYGRERDAIPSDTLVRDAEPDRSAADSATDSEAGPTTSASRFVPIGPVRLVDSRDGTGVAPGKFIGPTIGDVEKEISLAGLDGTLGVTSERSALVLNVTIPAASSSGRLKIYPCGAEPSITTVSFTASQGISSTTIIGASDKICVKATIGVHVIVDAMGFFQKGSGAIGGLWTKVSPVRVFDSRAGAAATEFTIPVGSFATGALGVVGHLSVFSPDGPGFARALPCGATIVPSAVNYALGETSGNEIIVPLGDAGTFCVSASRTIHVAFDLQATFGAGNVGYYALAPARLFDSRASAKSTAYKFTVPGLPAGTTTAILSLSAMSADAEGVATAHACGTPDTATTGVAVPTTTTERTTLTFAPVTASGEVCVATSTPMHIVADAVGALAP